MSHTRKILVTVAAAALVASATPPAAAESDTFKDRRGDIRSGFDIQALKVHNNGAWVRIRTEHRKLRRGPEGGVAVFINALYWDGGPVSDKGPEFVLSGGVGAPSGYGVSEIRRGWKSERTPLRCGSLRFHVNYKTDRVRFAVRRACLSRAKDMQVNDIRVAAYARVNNGRKDWAPKPRHFYRKVERG